MSGATNVALSFVGLEPGMIEGLLTGQCIGQA